MIDARTPSRARNAASDMPATVTAENCTPPERLQISKMTAGTTSPDTPQTKTQSGSRHPDSNRGPLHYESKQNVAPSPTMQTRGGIGQDREPPVDRAGQPKRLQNASTGQATATAAGGRLRPRLSGGCRAGHHRRCTSFRAGLCMCACHGAPAPFTLATIAPRLAQARDDYLAELAARRQERAAARDALQRAQWLVAHRELQLLRAGARRDSRYIARRQAKLDAARVELAHARAHAALTGAIPAPTRKDAA